jgi:beta-phosphoglucomutase-like phosphatase (HAD superfamily)
MKVRDYFQAVIVAEDVERVKPFPDIYLKCIEKLNLGKEKCVAIEDSATGLAAAKAAGIKCIAVPCEFTRSQDFSQADLRLEKISEITEEKIFSL